MTNETSIKLDYESGNRLESHVAKWLMEQAEDYNDMEGVFRDLFHSGCQSGYVTHLIYSADCHAFVREYLAEIEHSLSDMAEELGAAVLGDILFKDHHFSFDRMAWLVFVETARSLAHRNEIIL